MGYYIETPHNKGKAEQLVELYGARIVPNRPEFKDIKPSEAIICVVQNAMFDAAGFAYDQRELDAFARDFHGPQRLRTWLLMDRAKACELTGFEEVK